MRFDKAREVLTARNGFDLFDKGKKPNFGWLKDNTDVAIFSDEGRVGLACVVRDHDGRIVGLFKFVGNLHDPRMTELLCIREALRWIMLHYECNLRLEFDSLVAIPDINGNVNDAAYFGNLVADCKLFIEYFLNIVFNFIRRSTNCVAYPLARAMNFSMSDFDGWNVSTLEFLMYHVARDCG